MVNESCSVLWSVAPAPKLSAVGYAATRVAHNLGVTFGPPIGGLLLLAHSWALFFLGTAVLAAGALAVAWRFVPRRGAYRLSVTFTPYWQSRTACLERTTDGMTRVVVRRAGLVLQHLLPDHRPIPTERQLAGEHLVQDSAEAIQVAAPVDAVRLAPRLLGRHVGRGS